MTGHIDSLKSRSAFGVGDRNYAYDRLAAVEEAGLGKLASLPYCIRVLLENLLRNRDGATVTWEEDIAAVAGWPGGAARHEIAFRPARVLLQDFTGVPAVADLAAMREAIARMGGDPARVDSVQPADLVIDHSVQVDHFGCAHAFEENIRLELERNRERYQLLKWAQSAFSGFRVIPPDTGIVHQVNVEYLAPVALVSGEGETPLVMPDSVVGTDSHTPMINGLGVVGWGVGGIEAEAAMLGQSISMLLPEVVGFELTGKLREGVTATDLTLTIVQMLRKKGVVGRFVEFFGAGLDSLSLADRATVANMTPESGATVCFFPVDAETIRYLRFTGRDPYQVGLVERYYRLQGLFRLPGSRPPGFPEKLELDLGTVRPCLAGPSRPHDRIDLAETGPAWKKALEGHLSRTKQSGASRPRQRTDLEEANAEGFEQCERCSESARPLGDGASDATGGDAALATALDHGSVVIAAITSCTNTSNPRVMVGAGLLAKKAVEKGLRSKSWVKTSLAPGSQVVTDYLDGAGLTAYLEKLGFHLVAYGCTTCIGNSGPLAGAIADRIEADDLYSVAVLSGNRNFEGRINPHVRASYLCSPPLVVAYALAGRGDLDLEREPLGEGTDGERVFLRDIWPSDDEITRALEASLQSEMFSRRYGSVTRGTDAWRAIAAPAGKTFAWNPDSTYIRKPPFFDRVEVVVPGPPADIAGASVLVMLGDSVTTDHISPAGAIAADSPAARYLQECGVQPADFNSYGSRRGNHEVMVRGTFANIRLRNRLVPGVEGGFTRHLPSGRQMTIHEAAVRYRAEGTPLLVIAGRQYGSGSSRDWAAKGTLLLGVRAVIAQSYERIHRSNLVGMGVLPLQFLSGDSAESLGLSGEERYEIGGISPGLSPGQRLTVAAGDKRFEVIVRLDTAREVDYYNHGGVLQYVLRQLAG